MAWAEVVIAKKENRHEIILSGNEISERIVKSGLDLTIFTLTNLNYLNIHETTLSIVPQELEKLINLQTLVLHSNKIAELTCKLSQLTKLKVLDLSRNALKKVPEDICELTGLTTLNISNNQLETCPIFEKNTKLTVLELSNNKLKEFPAVCFPNMNVSELRLSGNEIESIPDKIHLLAYNLKVFYLNSNKIQAIPGELSDCNKLKEVDLKDNPLADKRLQKMIIQCHTKQVLDYIKQHCSRSSVAGGKGGKKGKKAAANKIEQEECEEGNTVEEHSCLINVRHFTNESLKIIIKEDVKDVRQYLVACVVLEVKFSEETFKKFIQIQTKLHETICSKRNLATIATHDLKKLGEGDLVYTALPPKKFLIKPLNRAQTMTGEELFNKLQTEAENLRKEKKRNVYSGVHKYLYLLEGKAKYPCLLNTANDVVSFPPITNSDATKMALGTTSFLLEVTSDASQNVCREVATTFLKEILQIFEKNIKVQQVKNVDVDGNLKSVYPARNDLLFGSDILVERD